MSNRALTATIIIVGVVLLVATLLVVALVFVGEEGEERPTPAVQEGTPVGSPAVVSDWFQVYFTTPRYPDNPTSHHGGLDERLVALIDGAAASVDVAVYDFDLLNVAQALARASERGVEVRMVTDTDTVENDDPDVQLALLEVNRGGITIVDDERSAIMHHKFTVVDERWVATGSWNYTDGDTYRLNNNLVVIDSERLADNYTAVFERMYEDGEFGPDSAEDIPDTTLALGPNGAPVENCFSPGQGCALLVEDALLAAEESIHFMAFSFTLDPLGDAMVERAEDGVEVAGVFETTGSETQFSQYGALRDAGLEVYQDGSPYAMHHKVIVIDAEIVVFGSYNFSANADESNNENLLIVEDAALAAAFEAEFQRVLELAREPVTR